MDNQLISSVLSFVGGVITALTPHLYKEYRHRKDQKEAPGGSGPLSTALLSWLELSAKARKKLASSRFIQVDGTRDALFDLVASAHRNSSLLAICGTKGDFSGNYYEKNFESCRAVKRVFSYEAIRSEIEEKRVPYALNGLKMHIEETQENRCDVEVALIPKGKLIRDMGAGSFDPPLSFGLAILLDGNDSPSEAIIHWEGGAKALRHLISIEGIIIDSKQSELLDKLVKLHGKIAGSDLVISSRKNPELITEARDELQKVWDRTALGRGAGP